MEHNPLSFNRFHNSQRGTEVQHNQNKHLLILINLIVHWLTDYDTLEALHNNITTNYTWTSITQFIIAWFWI